MMKNNRKGFSLVELSVSLVIIGIVFLAVMSSLRSISASMSAVTTEEKLDKAVETIMDLTLSDPSTSMAFSTSEYQIPKEDTFNENFAETDGYGNTFIYKPATNIRKQSGDTICEAKQTNLSIELHYGSTIYKTIKNVAFIVSGNGPDLQQDIDYTANPIKIDIQKDDPYKYVSLFEFKMNIDCPTVQPFQIINEELPMITSGVKNLIFASGNIDTQKYWCVAAANATQQAIVKEGLRFDVIGDSGIDIENLTPKTNGKLVIQNTDSGCDNDLNYKQGKALIVDKASVTSPYHSGSYKFTIYVKDSSQTVSSSKSFVQTVYIQ